MLDNQYTIVRNGASKDLVMTKFSKRSPNAGKEFPTVEMTQSNFDSDVNWIGKDFIVSVTNARMRAIFGAMYTDNIDAKTGQLNLDAWKAEAEDFTAGATRLGDIEDEIELIVTDQVELTNDDKFSETDENGAPTPEALAVQQKIANLAAKLRPLKAQKKQIEEKWAAVVAKRKATEAANEAKKTETATA